MILLFLGGNFGIHRWYLFGFRFYLIGWMLFGVAAILFKPLLILHIFVGIYELYYLSDYIKDANEILWETLYKITTKLCV